MKTFPLDPIEKASVDELRALQLERLKWSLKHAYDNVEHYRRKFDAAQREWLLSTDFGRTIQVEEISANAYADFLFGEGDKSGMPHQMAVVQSLHSRYSSNDFLGNANVLTWLLGRTPTTFEQFVAAQHAAFVSLAVHA